MSRKHSKETMHEIYYGENKLYRECTVEKICFIIDLDTSLNSFKVLFSLIGISFSQTHVHGKENARRVAAHRVSAQHHQSVHLVAMCRVLMRSGTSQ